MTHLALILPNTTRKITHHTLQTSHLELLLFPYICICIWILTVSGIDAGMWLRYPHPRTHQSPLHAMAVHQPELTRAGPPAISDDHLSLCRNPKFTKNIFSYFPPEGQNFSMTSFRCIQHRLHVRNERRNSLHVRQRPQRPHFLIGPDFFDFLESGCSWDVLHASLYCP